MFKRLRKKRCLFCSKLGPHSTRSLLSPRTEPFPWASAEELKELFRRKEHSAKGPESVLGRRWEVSALTHPRADVAPCWQEVGWHLEVLEEEDQARQCGLFSPSSLTSQAGLSPAHARAGSQLAGAA